MKSLEQITTQVQQIVWEQLHADNLCNRRDRAFEILGADDLDLIEIEMELEDYFDVRVEFDELPEAATINSVARYIHSELEKKA